MNNRLIIQFIVKYSQNGVSWTHDQIIDRELACLDKKSRVILKFIANETNSIEIISNGDNII